MEMCHDYDDIINLPHHISEIHPQMPAADRAAQFSPFAALTGYDDAIVETARLTDSKRDLTEGEKQKINSQLNALQARMRSDPFVTVVFFEKDLRKDGGSYKTVMGAAKKLDEYSGALELSDGTRIAFDDILSLE